MERNLIENYNYFPDFDFDCNFDCVENFYGTKNNYRRGISKQGEVLMMMMMLMLMIGP